MLADGWRVIFFRRLGCTVLVASGNNMRLLPGGPQITMRNLALAWSVLASRLKIELSHGAS